MNLSFIKYFFSYTFKSRTRQKLLFLSVVGLLISSFSLMVVQGIMGGLQSGLVARSKTVLGSATLEILDKPQVDIKEISSLLLKNNIKFVPEYEIELMIQGTTYVKPIILHGLDFETYMPEFLADKDTDHIVLGSGLGRDLRSYFGSKLIVTSPSHTTLVFTQIPRRATSFVSDYYSSELPEIDGIHGWVRLAFIQNLIRKREINKFRIYDSSLRNIENVMNDNNFQFLKLVTWEDKNATLVWALGLETKVMLFLFIGMSFLIGICIISGFLIFYNKIKVDLSSFWILGMSRDKMMKLIFIYGQLLSFIFSILGVLLGIGFLSLLQSENLVIMPEHFVERNIPVKMDIISILISLGIPYLFATVFTYITFKLFKNENFSFLSLIKKVG